MDASPLRTTPMTAPPTVPSNPFLACFPDPEPLHRFDWAAHGVEVPYVIFFTGCCGSTHLIHLLHDTGLCGRPYELFNESRVASWVKSLNVTNLESYFEAIVGKYVQQGRWGFKIDPTRLGYLADSITFTEVFPVASTQFFWMTRRDILSQAWSYATAVKSGVWHIFADGGVVPATSKEAITVTDLDWWRQIFAIVRAEATMETFFAKNGIVPIRIDYEGLVADRNAVLIAVLSHLGCSPSEIEHSLPKVENRTVRLPYDAKYQRLTTFMQTYPTAIAHILSQRTALDASWLRQELKQTYGITL